MSMMTGNVNLNGGGGGGGYEPIRKKRQPAVDPGSDNAPRSSMQDGDGSRGGYHRADVQEIFVASLQEPFRSALSTLMSLLEQVNNIPQEVRIAIVSGPLGYMSNIRSPRPAPFVPTPTLLKPVVR